MTKEVTNFGNLQKHHTKASTAAIFLSLTLNLRDSDRQEKAKVNAISIIWVQSYEIFTVFPICST
jgi:hypothetical protein